MLLIKQHVIGARQLYVKCNKIVLPIGVGTNRVKRGSSFGQKTGLAWRDQSVTLLRCYSSLGCSDSGFQLFCVDRSGVSHVSYHGSP